MIELLFSDSAAASLALAKATGDTSGIVSTQITADTDGNEIIEACPPAAYSGERVAGEVSDIAAIWLLADIGDISDLSDWRSRLRLLRDISDAYEFESDDWVEKEAQRAKALVQRLQNAARSAEPVRVWWSDAPGEACGFYWAMQLLEHASGPVYSVKVPLLKMITAHDTLLRSTGELAPGDFSAMLVHQKPVLPKERTTVARLWRALVAENSPLRAMLNGTLCSVPEDFYDSILRRVFPKGAFPVVQAIGLAMAKGPGGVWDWWYAQRIRAMLRTGELVLVKGAVKFYYSYVQKAVQPTNM